MKSTHSFYAEAVISNDLTNDNLASRIQARIGFKSYEVQAVIAALAEATAATTAWTAKRFQTG